MRLQPLRLRLGEPSSSPFPALPCDVQIEAFQLSLLLPLRRDGRSVSRAVQNDTTRAPDRANPAQNRSSIQQRIRGPFRTDGPGRQPNIDWPLSPTWIGRRFSEARHRQKAALFLRARWPSITSASAPKTSKPQRPSIEVGFEPLIHAWIRLEEGAGLTMPASTAALAVAWPSGNGSMRQASQRGTVTHSGTS